MIYTGGPFCRPHTGARALEGPLWKQWTFMLRVPCLCRIVSFVQHGRFSGRPVENPRHAVLRVQPVPDRTHMVNPFIDYANFLPCGEVFGDQRLELPLPIFHVSATNHKDEWLVK